MDSIVIFLLVIILLFLFNDYSSITANPINTDSDIDRDNTATVELHRTKHRYNDIEPRLFRGVNLGGWLVLEPWITPSLFQPYLNTTIPPVDEWTLCELLGSTVSRSILESHWNNWLLYEDLLALSVAGINTVRIPIGYWAINIDYNEPYIQGQLFYLERALQWCSKLGLSVIIDLHGAPGSQNGFDNSGRRGPINWNNNSPMNNTYYNIIRTLNILTNLTLLLIQPNSIQQPYSGPIIGIELLNEIFVTVPFNIVIEFYRAAYSVLRLNGLSEQTISIVLGDSFRLDNWINNRPLLFQSPQYENIYLDTHIYHVFDNSVLSLSYKQHLIKTCTIDNIQLSAANQVLWTIIGEFSLATTDCARWLNGFNTGSRWDGTFNNNQYHGPCTGNSGNNITQYTTDYLLYLNQFASIQFQIYESTGRGWFFWNFKTDPKQPAPQWDFLLGLKLGYIPNPVSNRNNNLCNQLLLNNNNNNNIYIE